MGTDLGRGVHVARHGRLKFKLCTLGQVTSHRKDLAQANTINHTKHDAVYH